MGNNNSLLDASRTGDLKKVSEILGKIKSVDNFSIKDEKGRTALILSSLFGHKEIVELILLKGSNSEDKCNNGLTALLYASSRGYKEIVQSLLLHGADIEARDIDLTTSLLYAAHKGHVEVVKILLEKGADVQARNASGMSALLYASHQGYAEIVYVLIDAGADVEARGDESRLQVAIRRALQLKQECAAADSDNYDNSNSSTTINTVKIDQRAIDAKAGGYTALMRAASYGHVEIVKILVDHGNADIHATTCGEGGGKKAVDFARNPPSHIERTSRHDEVVQLLLMQHSSSTTTTTTTMTTTSSPSPPLPSILPSSSQLSSSALYRCSPPLSLFLDDK